MPRAKTDPTTVRLYITPGSATPDQIADVLVALSEVHRQHAGVGLHFKVEKDGSISGTPHQPITVQ